MPLLASLALLGWTAAGAAVARRCLPLGTAALINQPAGEPADGEPPGQQAERDEHGEVDEVFGLEPEDRVADELDEVVERVDLRERPAPTRAGRRSGRTCPRPASAA